MKGIDSKCRSIYGHYLVYSDCVGRAFHAYPFHTPSLYSKFCRHISTGIRNSSFSKWKDKLKKRDEKSHMNKIERNLTKAEDIIKTKTDIMENKQWVSKLWFILLMVLGLTLGGCGIIKGIFEAGVWIGVLVCVAIVALLIWLIVAIIKKIKS